MASWWKIKRESSRIARQLSGLVLPLLGYVNRFIYDSRRASTVTTHRGMVDLKDEVSILLVYQPNGILDSTIAQIQWLSDNGQSVLLVSNTKITDEDRYKLIPMCFLIVERPNLGYDFGGYREGVLQLRDRDIIPKFLYIMNDSIWLPISNDANVIREGREASEDVWGIFLSLDTKPRTRGAIDDEHIQSFFFRFSSSVLKDPGFWSYWEKMSLINSKRIVIKLRELQMGNYFKKLGYKIGALYNWKEIRSYILENNNEEEIYAIIKQQCVLRDRHAKSILPLIDSSQLSAVDARDQMSEQIKKHKTLFYSFAMHPYVMSKFKFPFLKKAYSDDMIAMRRELVRLGLHNDFLPEVRREVATWDSARSDGSVIS
ncbi:MAG: rhamnan synthesis F family protein [Pseudomonadota bacterium]